MKHFRAPIVGLLLTGVLLGAAGAATVQHITADLRPDITVQVDGEKQTLLDKNGDVVYPITYDGTTYLPIRALGNAMDLEVEWNSKTQTVSLYTKTDTKPEDLTLEKLTERTEEAEDTVAELKAASTYAGRKDQYDLHSETIDNIRDDLHTYAQRVNAQHMDGKLKTDEFNVLTTRIDKLDNRLKDALDLLRSKTIGDETGKLTVEETHARAIDELTERVKAVEAEIKDLKPAETDSGRLKQYKDMAVDLSLLSKDISAEYKSLNAHLRDESLTNRQYNALNGRINALDVRMKDAWDDLADKTVDYDGKDDDASKPEGSGAYDSYVKQIEALDAKADQRQKDVENYKPAKGEHNNTQAWRAIERKLDALDDEIDALEDAIERDYKAGKLTGSEYRDLNKQLDKVDDRVDDLDDWYDDDWDDDDHHDHDDDDDDDWDD